MAYSIMLDAGHGGQDPGAVYKGRQEKNDNLKLALAVGEILKNKGIDISYTRTGDVYQTPFEKAQLANQAGVDYFISFHRNSSPKENQYNGAEVLIYDKSGIKYQMAENILGALGEVGFREIGVKERPGLVVLRRTRMPACPSASLPLPVPCSPRWPWLPLCNDLFSPYTSSNHQSKGRSPCLL